MLTICLEYCKACDLKFNVNKFNLIVLGWVIKKLCLLFYYIGAETLGWVAEMNTLVYKYIQNRIVG